MPLFQSSVASFAEPESLSAMTTRKSRFWRLILVFAQLVVIGEAIAVRVTPLARQYTGVSAYAAMLSMAAWAFLLFGSPFFWRSHPRLAISGSCIAVGLIFVTLASSW